MWAQIGEAPGITKRAAYDFYRRQIEEQEKHLPDPRDTAAARRVRDDWPSLPKCASPEGKMTRPAHSPSFTKSPLSALQNRWGSGRKRGCFLPSSVVFFC